MCNEYKGKIFDKGMYGNTFWEYFEDGTLVFKYSQEGYLSLTWKRGEAKPVWLEKYRKAIRKIIFSEGIRYIGTHYYDIEVRLSECQNLNEIVFPKSLQYIETKEAFRNLSITQMTVGVLVMGRWGDKFAGGHKLNKLIIDTKEVQSDFCRYFQNLRKIILTNRVQYINTEAFKNCKKLEKVEIQGDLYAIDDHAFENCISLKEIILPATVVWIGNQCFCGCEKLHFVNRPGDLVNIGNDVFEDCQQIASECMDWYSKTVEKSHFEHIEIRMLYSPVYSYETIFQKLPELVVNELCHKSLAEQLRYFHYVRVEGYYEVERDYVWAKKNNSHSIKLSIDKIQSIVVFHGIIVQINKWELGDVHKCGMYEREELVMYADSQYRELRPTMVKKYEYYEWIELDRKCFIENKEN